jgi:hypothetical protein
MEMLALVGFFLACHVRGTATENRPAALVNVRHPAGRAAAGVAVAVPVAAGDVFPAEAAGAGLVQWS